ncbi:MAG: leucine-rich repeat domain-containing protein, partial [Treponema sp.]|nr:leucine-rich repeat domain-containing protein [Treponema sp.]
MKKKMCLVTAFMALLCALLIAGCGQKPIPHTELAARLGSIKGGASPDAPSTVKIAPVNIMAVWRDINRAVYTAGKYLILDLSACSIPENTIDDNFGEVIQDNEYLKGIILPDSLTGIGRGAFWGCSNLTSVTIPAGLTAIDPGAFSGCTSLSTITAKSANTAFASEDGVLFSKDKTTLLIYSNGKGTSYTIPNSVTSIG